MRMLIALLLALLPFDASAENRLAKESSLYLQQHADQPIDWYPWGEEALEKARAEGKLIFISVGYAACHWCHVMAEESFEDETIAEQLNTGFVAIKIDRDRRPDLDEQFTLVSTMLSGTAGWPNSIVMTPEGEPFFAGGYFPPDAFAQMLTAVTKAWQSERPQVNAFAAQTAARLRNYLDRTAVLGEVTSADISEVSRDMISDLDPFNGGFGTAPKFPRESVLLHLLDQAARHGDTELLSAVTLTLDGMLRGGIHDHVGGGFHRYAIDPEWLVPHFEKMLYNQALLGRVLIRSYALTGDPDYARAATRLFDYVLRDMQAPEGGFYAAQDADSLLPTGARKEGHAYVWTPEQLAAALGEGSATLASALGIEDQGDFEGLSIPHLDQLPIETARLQGLTVAEFDTRLEILRRTRARRPAPIRDEKIILSWNAEMIATLAEAASVLNRPDYMNAATRAMRFLLGALVTETGFNRLYYQGRSDITAQLPDIAALGRALLVLHDHGNPDNWLAQAQPLADLLLRDFRDSGRAMRMTAKAAGFGTFRPVDDTELPSGNALCLSFLAGLDRRLTRAGEIAPDLAAAVALQAMSQPKQRAGLLTALEESRHGPSGPMRISSGGAVHILARADREARLVHFDIRIGEGWHINAHTPLEDHLIGMALAIDTRTLPETAFPDPILRELGFSKTPLALYENRFTLTAPLTFPEDGPAQSILTLQACDDQQCLPPDDMPFYFWPGSPRADQ